MSNLMRSGFRTTQRLCPDPQFGRHRYVEIVSTRRDVFGLMKTPPPLSVQSMPHRWCLIAARDGFAPQPPYSRQGYTGNPRAQGSGGKCSRSKKTKTVTVILDDEAGPQDHVEPNMPEVSSQACFACEPGQRGVLGSTRLTVRTQC
jgi:hypothetical protein